MNGHVRVCGLRMSHWSKVGTRSVRPPNNQIKPPVVPVTRLAFARRAPAPPAAYLAR